jgi:cyclic pyranopterin monophosphate synthase
MLSHVNRAGKAVMVNIQKKVPSLRTAIAQCIIKVPDNVYNAVLENNVKKGDVIAVSRIAGIMGAKRTSELIPLCHQINLDTVEINIDTETKNEFIITSKAIIEHKTGVEMEALTAVSISALTFYDMCKALSKEIIISEIKLIEKTGGKSEYIDSN